jgi:hypothetical protein
MTTDDQIGTVLDCPPSQGTVCPLTVELAAKRFYNPPPTWRPQGGRRVTGAWMNTSSSGKWRW